MVFVFSGCDQSDQNSSPRGEVLKQDDESSWMLAVRDKREGSNLILVDCEKGHDSNSGTTRSKPFKTIVKARARLLNLDGLMLRRGTNCYETLSLDLSTSSNKNNFTIGSFGSGDAPAYLFAAPLQSLKWTLATNISINGKVVSYLRNAPIYFADVPY